MKCKCTLTRTVLGAFAFTAMAFSSLSAKADYVTLTALSGSNPIAEKEGAGKLVDGEEGTKWGQSTNFEDGAERWIIVKADKAFTPETYFLVTGNDTNTNQDRNWKDWNIYGANFESDADATREAEAWTLIDQQIEANVSVANFGVTQFKMNENTDLVTYDGTPYQYYMIEVIALKQPGDHYMQMSEFGFGTYDEYRAWYNETHTVDPDKSINYTIIAGDRNNADGEGLPKLFDDDYTTKWGNGFSSKQKGATSGGAYFIVKTDRAIAPTYYKLVTGTDNASWKHRNWKQWQIYAIAPAAGEVPSRTSNGWVLLDDKLVTENELPDKNSFEVFFELSEENTTAYQYFKVEIDATMGDGYMQMTEFALGDDKTLVSDKNKAVKDAEEVIAGVGLIQKSLLDSYGAKLEVLKAATDIFAVSKAKNELNDLVEDIQKSAYAYSVLQGAIDKAKIAVRDKTVNAETAAYLAQYVGETEIAPNTEFPAGNAAYIQANAQLDATEAQAEAARINSLINENLDIEITPISVKYETIIDANGFNDNEKGHSLVDGDRDGTKWCANTGHKPWTLVFKSTEPIRPTYYGLVTGGDTYSYPTRNWKTWNVYAANFESDEEATINSDKWILIDERKNVGKDILDTRNKFESYIDLSATLEEDYQYFKIEVIAGGGDLIQMNEFTFYNQGNFKEYRQGFVDEINKILDDRGLVIDENTMAPMELIQEFLTKKEQLGKTSDAPSLMAIKNRLVDLMDEITSSVAYYEDYMAVADEINGSNFAAYEQAAEWAEGYATENVGPGAKYVHGTKEYILANRNLSVKEIQTEVKYLNAMLAAAEDPEEAGYIVLDGHTDGEWGDGSYYHIVDNSKNDEGQLNTKWGGSTSPDGDTYVIFRTIEAVNPYFYTLTTGGDTYSYQGRNWKRWEIYGANFEGDGAATRNAEGWVLVDQKENVGQNRLHPENLTASYFGFSTETQEKYTYYKVVVYEAYSGGQFQMQELRFGTEEEFEEIKDQYVTEANEFEYDILAEQALIDEYAATVGSIDECTSMEPLFRIHDQLEQLQKAITTSHKNYTVYENQVEANKEYLKNTVLADSEAKTLFQNYLSTEVKPSEELYPNGSAVYVIDEHVLGDSAIIAETKFMESLKAAAVAAGYGKGADVSSLIINRSMSEKAQDHVGGGIELTGWNGVAYRTATSVDEEGNTMSSAEFVNSYATTYDMNQTISNLTNGYYKVTLNAAFRPNGDITSSNHNAYAYANSTKTFIPVVLEDMTEGEEGAWMGTTADKPIYACDITEPVDDPAVDSLIVGYVVWGCEGSNNAFANDRYAITMVAKVTDGTLKLGIANDGTTYGSDWTCAGNFGLVYLGEEEADAAEALAEAAACNAARTEALEAYAALETIDATEEMAEYKKAPGFGIAQLAALNKYKGVATFEASEGISELTAAIADTKKAYTALVGIKDVVNQKWNNLANNAAAETAVYDIADKLTEGVYENAEAATKAGADLLNAYPALLAIENENSTVSADMDDNSFNYTVIASGRNPIIVIGGADGKGLYEGLKKDQIKEATLTFEYKSDATLNSLFYVGGAADDTNVIEKTLEATTATTVVTIDITKAVKEWDAFAAATDIVRWQLAKGQVDAEVTFGKAQINVVAKPAVEPGDVNGDGAITIKDVVAVLEIMAADGSDEAADVNGDGAVTIKDVVAVLEIMAAQ